jgi:excinuclease ABC subunit B
MFDLEQLEQIGYCNGVENYSRFLTGQKPGTPPPCLLNYFPKDWLLIVDESHVSIPQVGGMYRGDRARKETLVDYGFRLPAALDNRPLKFEEFEGLVNQVVYVSATPSKYELEKCGGVVVEQIIRPTGLVDPNIEVRPAQTRSTTCCTRFESRRAGHARAGDHAHQTHGRGPDRLLPRPGHSRAVPARDIETLERTAILRDLRLGEFDVLVGINLLREGLDLPEVGLVAVLDADKEGFLRNVTSLIQTIGRAARNVEGRVILYADRITNSMQHCIDETLRRRRAQMEYNTLHNITPRSVIRAIHEVERPAEANLRNAPARTPSLATRIDELMTPAQAEAQIRTLREQMREAARKLEFELAGEIRDKIRELEKVSLGMVPPP